MKKAFAFILAGTFFILLFTPSCKEQGEPYIVWRKITNQMINSYGANMFLRADEDSVYYSGIHVAKIGAHIYDISDSFNIVKFGHVYSIDNPNPTLNTAARVFASDSVSFNPADSVLDYVSTLTSLGLDTSYYVRSFVILSDKNGDLDTAYNRYVKQFHTARPEDIWFIRKDFPSGSVRTEAVSFTLNNEAYIGTGANGLRLLGDFWKYNPTEDSWTAISNGIPPRYKASAFVIYDSAYVGMGLASQYDSTAVLGDLWMFNGVFWVSRDSIDINAERYDAVGFSGYYHGKMVGFIAFGRTVYERDDIYVYDPTQDTPDTLRGAWYKGPILSPARYGAIAVTLSGGHYVFLGGGRNEYGYLNDYYIFDLDNEVFRSTSGDFPGPARYNAVTAAIKFDRDGTTHEYVYVGTGQGKDGYLNDWYAYDLLQQKWMVKSYIHQDFIVAKPRGGAVAFPVEKNYVEYGLNIRIFVVGGYDGENYLTDVWEYLP